MEASSYGRLCGMNITYNLGIYLGMPLIHGRIKMEHFDHIVSKLHSKLSGWKANTLSLAGRATLVQSVTASLPIYTMQTFKIPITFCVKIDRLNRNFLWGHENEKNKVHLVKWRNVCKPKRF